MSRPNRVQAHDDYNIGDWYSASRKSRAMSVMPEHQQQQGPYHYPSHLEPLPVQPPAMQQLQQQAWQPRQVQPPNYSPHPVPAGGGNYDSPADKQGQAYHTQNRPPTQQQRLFVPTSNNAYAPAGHNASEAQFSSRAPAPIGFSQRPTTANTVGFSQRPTTANTTGFGQRPVTSSTVGSGHAMGLPFPASLRQSKSRQELLQCYGVSPVAEKTLYLDVSSATAGGYVPPARPATAAAQLSRNKTLKDGYSSRRAGGDSGMGECCGSCCGGCMRCACISACCCLSPIISWLLTLLVLVGIALALYFNWGRITGALSKGDSSTAAPPTPTPPAVPTAALSDLVNTAANLLASVIASTPVPVR